MIIEKEYSICFNTILYQNHEYFFPLNVFVLYKEQYAFYFFYIDGLLYSMPVILNLA